MSIRLFEDRDRVDRLVVAIAVGVGELARGEVVEWTPDLVERLKLEAAEEERQNLPLDDDVTP